MIPRGCCGIILTYWYQHHILYFFTNYDVCRHDRLEQLESIFLSLVNCGYGEELLVMNNKDKYAIICYCAKLLCLYHYDKVVSIIFTLQLQWWIFKSFRRLLSLYSTVDEGDFKAISYTPTYEKTTKMWMYYNFVDASQIFWMITVMMMIWQSFFLFLLLVVMSGCNS